MILLAIAAMGKNRVIGSNNKLPWSIPEDMKFFREKTKGNVMIMGRKTFESLGGKVLPDRFHIVVTRNKSYVFHHPQVQIVSSLEEAIQLANDRCESSEEVFLIGGGDLYNQSLQLLNGIYLTVIDREYPGDTVFPEFDENDFKLISKRDCPGEPSFSFHFYRRNESVES